MRNTRRKMAWPADDHDEAKRRSGMVTVKIARQPSAHDKAYRLKEKISIKGPRMATRIDLNANTSAR